MDRPSSRPVSPFVAAGRLAGAALLLWLLWSWSPPGPTVPAEIAVPASAEALASVPPGREFLLEGMVRPAAGDARPWRGRFVYRQAERVKDDLGVSFWRVVRESRPAVRFAGPAGDFVLPPSSYGLRHAPEVGSVPWHAWNQENRGFRAGDAAVARGVVGDDGVPRVRELARGPLAAYRRHAFRADGARRLLTDGGRAFITLLVLAWAASAWEGRTHRQSSSRASGSD